MNARSDSKRTAPRSPSSIAAARNEQQTQAPTITPDDYAAAARVLRAASVVTGSLASAAAYVVGRADAAVAALLGVECIDTDPQDLEVDLSDLEADAADAADFERAFGGLRLPSLPIVRDTEPHGMRAVTEPELLAVDALGVIDVDPTLSSAIRTAAALGNAAREYAIEHAADPKWRHFAEVSAERDRAVCASTYREPTGTAWAKPQPHTPDGRYSLGVGRKAVSK
jgi:hypothetical protein